MWPLYGSNLPSFGIIWYNTNFKVTSYPSFLNEGFLIQQPIEVTGRGKVITIDVTGSVNIYVAIDDSNDFEISGGYEKSLPEDGWRKETGEISLDKGYILLKPIYSKSFTNDSGGKISLPATTTYETTMAIIVVSICQGKSFIISMS